jgi:hypothetical protein
VETSGETAKGGRSVILRMTYAELVDVLLKPKSRTGRRFSAVIAY